MIKTKHTPVLLYRVTECDSQGDMLCPLCDMSYQREPVSTQTGLLSLIFLVNITFPQKAKTTEFVLPFTSIPAIELFVNIHTSCTRTSTRSDAVEYLGESTVLRLVSDMEICPTHTCSSNSDRAKNVLSALSRVCSYLAQARPARD